MKGTILLVLAVAGVTCGPDPVPNSVALIVRVLDLSENPVAEAEIYIAGNIALSTDDTGEIKLPITGPEGRRVHVRVSCPEGWIPAGGDTREVAVQFLHSLDSTAKQSMPMKIQFRCEPKFREVLLVVRTNGRARLPVRVLGMNAAVTDDNGVAQAVIKGVPSDEFEVVIDTSDHPALRPAMPTRRASIPENNQILIFDQKFDMHDKKSDPRKKKRTRPRLPRRI
ncbi:MAG: hypothetical protein QNJ97_12705 [Myxococcota bacterium]|nr:hypothetical protein [Myxococcota bacterium]